MIAIDKWIEISLLSVRAGIPVARLKKYWAILEEESLGRTEILGTGRKLRVVREGDTDAIFEKVFWLMFENQNSSVNAAPYLREGVAARIFEQVRIRDQTINEAAMVGQIDERRLSSWIEGGAMPNVAGFEKFLLQYRELDLFEFIDIPRDVFLQNLNFKRQKGTEEC